METYQGHVRTPQDAITLFEACRLGMLPRVQRRLSEKERQNIRSGSVFVWDEREAGMRRWTDGKSWSASRVSGSFLTYREMEGKRGGGNAFAPPPAAARLGKTPESTKGSDEDVEMQGDDGPDGYRYKPDGLMKQSFSITTSNNQHLHLISYYGRTHPNASGLMQPSNDPSLRHIRPPKGMYPESTVHENPSMPVVTRSPMPGAGYAPPVGLGNPPPGYPRPYGQYPIHLQGYPLHSGSLPWPPSPVATPPHHGMHPVAHQNGTSSPAAYPSPLATASTPLSSEQVATSLPPPVGHVRASAASSRLTPYPPNLSPRSAQAVLLAREAQNLTQSSPASLIDPRLTSPLSNPPTAAPGSAPPKVSPELPKVEVNPVRDPGTSSNTIPSIGTMINGARLPPSSLESTDTKSDHSGSRPGSRSPGGRRKATGPTDMPNEKLDFGEDKRALRQLDRAFKA